MTYLYTQENAKFLQNPDIPHTIRKEYFKIWTKPSKFILLNQLNNKIMYHSVSAVSRSTSIHPVWWLLFIKTSP